MQTLAPGPEQPGDSEAVLSVVRAAWKARAVVEAQVARLITASATTSCRKSASDFPSFSRCPLTNATRGGFPTSASPSGCEPVPARNLPVGEPADALSVNQ